MDYIDCHESGYDRWNERSGKQNLPGAAIGKE